MVRKILTDRQQSTLRLLADETDIRSNFVLSGGTALAAFYLHHRLSDDLDFFSRERVDILRIERFATRLATVLKAMDVTHQNVYDRRLFFLMFGDGTDLKLEFTYYPYDALEKPKMMDGFFVDSLRDCAANKLAALLDRFEPKDYYDLYFLLKDHCTLASLRSDVEKKFGLRIEPLQLGEALMRIERVPILPHLLVPVAPEEFRAFFVSLARLLKDEAVG